MNELPEANLGMFLGVSSTLSGKTSVLRQRQGRWDTVLVSSSTAVGKLRPCRALFPLTVNL